jgi:hypothetical protein
LFEDLFARNWKLLDEQAQRVPLIATFSHTSTSAEALATTADVHGLQFHEALEQLVDLALLDEQRDTLESPRATRYTRWYRHL